MSLNDLNINTDYPCNTSNYAMASNRTVKWIVVHYTGGNGTALANVKYFQSSLPSDSKASAHYFVGHASENAQIYQSVPPEDIAWHCGANVYYSECRNSTSIGIETCCHNDTKDQTAESLDWYFDDETVDALVELVKTLMSQYGIDTSHVIRHYDVTHKLCPAMWVHDEDAWLNFKARLTDDNSETGENEDDMVRYERLSDIPNAYGFRDIIETLMNANIIQGDGSDPTGNNDVIDLSIDQVRVLVYEYRGGGFDKKLIAEGLPPAVS